MPHDVRDCDRRAGPPSVRLRLPPQPPPIHRSGSPAGPAEQPGVEAASLFAPWFPRPLSDLIMY
jgi:hypothetical protein